MYKHADLYRSFCPDILESLYLEDGTGISTAPQKFVGAYMTIDLSGFTRLSAELCQQGNTGLDELRHKINQYFGRFADAVRDHGGDGAFSIVEYFRHLLKSQLLD